MNEVSKCLDSRTGERISRTTRAGRSFSLFSPLSTFVSRVPIVLAFYANDGKQVVCHTLDQRLWLWDRASRKSFPPKGFTGSMYGWSFGPHGKQVAFFDATTKLHVRELGSGQERLTRTGPSSRFLAEIQS